MVERRVPSAQSAERRLARQVLGDLPGRLSSWNEELARLLGALQRGRHLDGDRERIAARLAEMEVQLRTERAKLEEQLAGLDGAARNSRIVDVLQAMARLLGMLGEMRAQCDPG